jgi:hypothetical protein
VAQAAANVVSAAAMKSGRIMILGFWVEGWIGKFAAVPGEVVVPVLLSRHEERTG